MLYYFISPAFSSLYNSTLYTFGNYLPHPPIPIPPHARDPALRQVVVILVLIEDLIRILQYRVHDPDMPGRIGDIRARAHERGSEHDRQVLGVHPVHRAVLDHPMKMQRQRP